jgi:hypothetical protein
LQLAAEVSFQQGIIPTPVSDESVRRALKRLKTNWKRAKHADHQPRPALPTKKNARDRLIAWTSRQAGWAIGFLDEVWWRRFALPRLSAWQDEDHTVPLVEQCWKKGDPDPKALACYGILWQHRPAEEPIRDQMSLRFVTGRPESRLTIQFLQWGCDQLQAQGKIAWLLIWDNARLPCEQARAHLDSPTQRSSENRGQGRAHPALLFADHPSLA